MVQLFGNFIYPGGESLSPVSPGVLESKLYVAKIDNATFSLDSGSAAIRKDDGTLVIKTWPAVASVDIAALNGAALDPGQLRWIVFEWEDGSQQNIVLRLRRLWPTTYAEYTKLALVGRLWNTGGVVTVSGLHVGLSEDHQADVAGVGWWQKARNISITAYPVNSGTQIALTAGEHSRWPVLRSPATRDHIFDYPGLNPLSDTWVHLRSQGSYATTSTCTAANLLSKCDTGGAAWVATTAGKYYVHGFGVYAGSNERVWVPGQTAYQSISEARAAALATPFVFADWADDAQQITPVVLIVARAGESVFETAGANCEMIPWRYWRVA